MEDLYMPHSSGGGDSGGGSYGGINKFDILGKKLTECPIEEE